MTTQPSDWAVALLPCPFCGGRGEVGGLIPWVECQACEASGPQAETEEAAIAAWNTRTHSAEIAGALRDAERLDWMASGEQKMLQRSIDGQWFRVYRDVAAQDAEHAEWSAMTEAHFTTARAAIDSAMQQGGGGGE